MDIILTCDIGTTACKCSAFTPDGTKLTDARVDYDTVYPHPGWAQQDADRFVEAAFAGLKSVASRIDTSAVRVIGLSGQMNALIPVDDHGNALYPSIIHSDSRSAPQIDTIARVIAPDDFYRLTGNRLDCHYTLTKLLWLKENEPDIYRKMRFALQSKDYVYSRLTGHTGTTDYSDASLTIALRIADGKWARELLTDLGLSPAVMPQILPSHDVSGHLCAKAAAITGLPEGIPVSVGGGDGACAARGAGLKDLGEAYCTIGSSAWVAQFVEKPLLDKDARVFNYFDMDGKHLYTCGTLQCGAAAFDWARGIMALDGRDGIAEMEKMAAEIAPGAEGVLFFPELMGSRTPYWDPRNRGCLVGLSLFHDRRHIARAVLEGIAMGLYSCGLAMIENGIPIGSLMLTGGGAKNRLWPEMLSALYRCPVSIHTCPQEATSLGAAIAAGVGAGIFPTYEDGAKCIRSDKTVTAPKEEADRYEKVYSVFREIYDRVSPIHKQVAEL